MSRARGSPRTRNVGFTELKRSRLDGLADASFDKAYCVAVFIHMDKEDFFLYLEEIARVLKPGGAALFRHLESCQQGRLAALHARGRAASQCRSEPAQGRRAQSVLDARGSARVPRARGFRTAADDERIAVGAGRRAEAGRRRRRRMRFAQAVQSAPSASRTRRSGPNCSIACSRSRMRARRRRRCSMDSATIRAARKSRCSAPGSSICGVTTRRTGDRRPISRGEPQRPAHAVSERARQRRATALRACGAIGDTPYNTGFGMRAHARVPEAIR